MLKSDVDEISAYLGVNAEGLQIDYLLFLLLLKVKALEEKVNDG